MSVRLTFLAAARNSSSRLAERFDDDLPLDAGGWAEAERALPALGPLASADLRYCSPSPRARETGRVLGLAPLAQLALRDCDMGRWRGHTLQEVMRAEPQVVDAWLADPYSAPHGGEPLMDFIRRVGSWIDTRPADGSLLLAVTEPSVVRAALVYALKAPPATYWRIDVMPLSTISLMGLPGRWNLHLDGWA
ncbi:histidine phosphatase family protein [Streptomyces sp. NPDC051940]|uniref:histidine phosphatase family protein n=1 Tax=Streptomyces sp. NPDC051940 TaxID=3155675 RepID=UPI00342FD999